MMIADQSNALSWRKPGYSISYRPGEANHCPACGHQHWIVGRLMAECAFCGAALSLKHVHGYGAKQRFATPHQGYEPLPDELRPVA